MAATFHRVTGHQHCRRLESSATLAANTLAQYTENGEIGAGATAKAVAGIVLEAATNGTFPLVDLINEGDEIEARGVGVTLTATLVGNHVDQATGNELSLTDTNKDALCVRFIDAATGVFVFKRCAHGSSTDE